MRIQLLPAHVHRLRRDVAEGVVSPADHAAILPPAIPSRHQRQHVELIPRQQTQYQHYQAERRSENCAGDVGHVGD